MARIKDEYDVVIIGSGMGGLVTGQILSAEGYKVCILEKNAQIGGTLQTFYHDKTKFDTGVHYVGGLDPGQPLYPYFKYLGLLDELELEKMEEDGFDIISFSSDDQVYPIAQGYENFKQQLLKFFPEEEKGLDDYIDRIRDVCNSFSFYYLNSAPDFEKELEHYYIGAKDVIEDCVKDEKLRLILAANNMLYAGEGDKAPFYIHALVVNSYIESSYRILGGGSQISKILERKIKENGGDVIRNAEVTSMELEDRTIVSAQLKTGEIVKATNFISNIHPTQTFKLFDTSGLRKSYIKRVLKLNNTTSAFVLYLSLKPGTLAYERVNKYHFSEDNVWNIIDYDIEDWGKNFAIYSTPSKKNPGFTKSIIVITYMKIEEVEGWQETFNTTTELSSRDKSYQEFKEQKAKILFDEVEKRMPGLKAMVSDYTTSTPLTLRDYINSPNGSLYGVVRDFNSPLKSFVNTKTKVENLLLTGQNLVMHGVLGVTIGAIVTCCELLGREYLVDKIKEVLELEPAQ